MFVIGKEITKKRTKTNEHIMNILNNNQFFGIKKPKESQISFQYSQINKKDLKKILQEKKAALQEEKEKRNEIRDEIFQPAYCRKIHTKRGFLKSEEVSRTVNNKEPLQKILPQKIPAIIEKVEETAQPSPLPPSPKAEVASPPSVPKEKPKTAS